VTVQLSSHEVKQLVARAFLELGLAPPKLFAIKETIFIDHGRCLARTYRVPGMKAVWDVDDGIIRFYDDAGKILRTVNLLERMMPQSMAA
jgi:hypothetical protein